MSNLNRSGDTPFVQRPDLLEIGVTDQPYTFRGGDEKLNASIVEAINLMGGAGDGAEGNYQRALESLQESAEETIRLMGREYFDLPESQYLDRWAHVQLMTDLSHPSALDVFDRILSSSIPPEQSPNPHGFSTVGEEIMIRTAAIDGLERLSVVGNADARALLLKHVVHPNFSVRRASVQALVATGGEEEVRQLRHLLQERQEEFLLEIRRADVRQVPQAQGGLFLVSPETRGDPPPPNLAGNREL